MESTGALVLPSPFLGPAAYAELAAAMGGLGVPTTVATYDEPPVAARLVERWAGQAAARDDIVLVAHSNAGYLAPQVSRTCGDCPTVFVDAALPPASGTAALAPPALVEALRGLAGADGLLPPWTRWWTRDEVADTLPDPWFQRLDPSLPQVPLSYVEGQVTAPDGWEAGACAYLALGPSTYAEELERARTAGWPVAVLADARHLDVVVDPARTAAAVVELLGDLRQRLGRGM